MGRKIPAKKHRGVKDPLVQQARRLQSLKGKINAPPKDPDDQPVPKTLTRLFAFQNRDKTIKKKKKNKKLLSADGARDSSGSSNPVGRLQRLSGESGRQFSLRINSAVRALHDPLDQQHYPDDVESEDEKGERMSAQRERRRRKRGTGGEAGEAAASRAQRLALARREKKSKAAEEAAWARRAAAQYERVPFGDVAHAPPALRTPARAQPAQPAHRPARRGLLLAAMLGGGAAAAGAGEAAAAAARERARLDAVAAYRELKKQRRVRDKRPPA